MRAVILRSLGVIGLGAVVLAGVLYVASTVDGRPPTVAEVALTQPLPDEPTRGLIITALEIEFSEPVDHASAEAALRIAPEVGGRASWSGSTMIFTPAAPLEPAASYAVTIEPGVLDLRGNRMTEVPPPFEFETAGPPAVLETTPAEGATAVPLDGPIVITFSTLMDTASVEAALRVRPAFGHALRWSGTQLEVVPDAPLDADRDYEVAIGREAIDVAGLALDEPLRLGFHTLSAGLRATAVVPADGSDGIATTSPIAVLFDRPIDAGAASADGLLTITPDVAGTLAVADARGDEPEDDADGTILLFTPSGPLPPATTFAVEISAAVVGLDGGGLAEPLTWSFTTGAPASTLSNQVVFLTDRSGVANLWAMNPDGSAARQLSAELSPVLDYAVAPDGSSYVIGDGHRLVLADASGADRRVLTEDDVIEFDATYAPDSRRLAFARADAASGEGLGLWELAIDGGSATRIEMADDEDPTAPTGSGPGPVAPLRAPRYAPDGDVIAFVDLRGEVGVVDLEDGSVNRAAFAANAPPSWLADGSGVLVSGVAGAGRGTAVELAEVVPPLEPALAPDARGAVAILDPVDGSLTATRLGAGAIVAGIAVDGRVAVRDTDGRLLIAADPRAMPEPLPVLASDRVAAAAFSPAEDALAVVIVPSATVEPPGVGRLERIGLANGDRAILSNEGWRPRWLP
jgi:Bacterial Ig-like domain